MGVKSKIAVAASTLLLGASALSLLTPSSAEASTIVYSKETEGQDTVTLAPGEYEIEAWGGAGGYNCTEEQRAGRTSGYLRWDSEFEAVYIQHGGYGGYVKAKLTVTEATTLYITVGGMGAGTGNDPCIPTYNGGLVRGFNDDGKWINAGCENTSEEGGGGGATHVAIKMRGSGYTEHYEDYKSDLLLVAGGGSGASVNRNGL